MKKNKIVIKSDVEFRVQDEVEEVVATEIKKIVDDLSKKYHRNIDAEIKIKIA